MKQMKWFIALGLTTSALVLAGCGGAEKRDSLLSPPSPVSDVDANQADTARLPNPNTTIVKPDTGAEVEVINLTPNSELEGRAIGEGSASLESENLAENAPSNQTEEVKSFEPILYFGYDQFAITDESIATVKHYAAILMDNPELKLSLMGHTDERGTPEYNLALSEKRGLSAQEAFMLFGVGMGRIDVISLGEEQPLVDELSEEAYAKNRRVEIGIH